MVASAGVSQPDDWDEAQCEAALAQLEELQENLQGLRLNLSRVIDPFNIYPASGPAMYQAFKKSVVGSQNNIVSFKNQWYSQEIQSILAHTTESLGKDPDLTPSVNVPRWGWVESQAKLKQVTKRENIGVQKKKDTSDHLTNDDVLRMITDFRKTYPTIQILHKDDYQDLMFKFLAGARQLRIHVAIERDANGRHKLNADCSGTIEPWLSITRCIASRPNADDFKYLLDMIAAYKTVKGTSCAKCSKMIDRAALTPTARRGRQVVGNNEIPETVWEPFHELCLE